MASETFGAMNRSAFKFADTRGNVVGRVASGFSKTVNVATIEPRCLTAVERTKQLVVRRNKFGVCFSDQENAASFED